MASGAGRCRTITDGANALATMVGWADADRTCIVGWSYGGYAALASGALTPDRYKSRRRHSRRL
jgi:dipeptidyl aminopeptidase/acylaminoacyl peptidase